LFPKISAPGSKPQRRLRLGVCICRRDRSVPTVVLLHGSGGVLSTRELTYAPQLAKMGVAALVVDVFGARRDRGTEFIERLLNITETMMVADAYSGLWFLAGRPEIDPHRVVLIGFSYGAMATTFADTRAVHPLRGSLIARDDRIRELSNADLGRFLAEIFSGAAQQRTVGER
jgi:dienelactone hydrolase